MHGQARLLSRRAGRARQPQHVHVAGHARGRRAAAAAAEAGQVRVRLGQAAQVVAQPEARLDHVPRAQQRAQDIGQRGRALCRAAPGAGRAAARRGAAAAVPRALAARGAAWKRAAGLAAAVMRRRRRRPPAGAVSFPKRAADAVAILQPRHRCPIMLGDLSALAHSPWPVAAASTAPSRRRAFLSVQAVTWRVAAAAAAAELKEI